MKKADIKAKRTQDLILSFATLTGLPTCTKANQKQLFWVIDELIDRGVIEDDMEFVSRIRGLVRWDALPEKYMPLVDQ